MTLFMFSMAMRTHSSTTSSSEVWVSLALVVTQSRSSCGSWLDFIEKLRAYSERLLTNPVG